MENNLSEQQNSKTDEGINIKAILNLVRVYWVLFIICISISLLDAYLINRYSTRFYKIEGDILLSNQSKGKEGAEILGTQGLSEAFNANDPTIINDKIEVIKSKKFLKDVVKKLRYDHAFFQKGTIKTSEIYSKDLPIEFYFRLLNKEPLKYDIQISFDNNNYSLEITYKNSVVFSKKKLKYDDSLVIQNCVLFLHKKINPGLWSYGKKWNNLSLSLYDIDNVAGQYSSNLEIIQKPQTKIIQVSIEASQAEKARDFIAEVSNSFIEKGLIDKNEKYNNTLNFINEQLVKVEGVLGNYEFNLESFKKNSGIIDWPSQSAVLLTERAEMDKNLKGQEILLKKVIALKEYVEKHQDLSTLAPATFGISDPLLVPLITDLSRASNELNELSYEFNQKTPQYQRLQQRLLAAKKLLIENINNIVTTTKSILSNYKSGLATLQSKISVLPGIEREGQGMLRKSTIQEKLYLLLLEKKFEYEIARSGNKSDYSILNEAAVIKKTQPNTKNIYSISLIIGLLIPALYIFFKIFLDDKLRSKEQIEKLSNIPFLGSIPHHTGKEQQVFLENSKSMIAESFRNLRSNILFMVKNDSKSKLILVTSTISGEGKTFCTLNLANVIGLSGAKVVVIGLDLRKPRLHLTFDIKNDVGMSNYLTGRATLDQIIHKTSTNNIDIIPSGPVPPNPSELILSNEMKTCIEELKSMYDYILLDTAPLGLVTDAANLMREADLNVFVMREAYSQIGTINFINEFYETQNIKNMGIILNDSTFSGAKYGYGYGYNYGYGYGYGYGYSYGYGYGYYSDDDTLKRKKTFLQKIKHLFTN